MIRIKLSRVMGDRRITQAELCRKTGIGKHTINDLYQDFTDRVSLSQLDTICDALSARWKIFSNTRQIRRDLASLTDSITKNGDTWPCCNTIRPRRGAVSAASLLSYTHNKTYRSLSILFPGIRLL